MSDEQVEPNESKLKFELAFPYDIRISPTVNGGAIIRVGCAELSYDNTNKMLKALREYFADPEAAEAAYCKCNALRAGPQAVPTPTLRRYPNGPDPAGATTGMGDTQEEISNDRPAGEGMDGG